MTTPLFKGLSRPASFMGLPITDVIILILVVVGGLIATLSLVYFGVNLLPIKQFVDKVEISEITARSLRLFCSKFLMLGLKSTGFYQGLHLISIGFLKNQFTATVDKRWTNFIGVTGLILLNQNTAFNNSAV